MHKVLLLFLSLTLAGCASSGIGETLSSITDLFGDEDNADPPAELVEYPAEITIEERWDEKVGVGAEGQALNLVPAIGYGSIIAADREGVVQARDLASGALRWEVELETPCSGGPGMGKGTVVIGTSDAEVIALNSETGAQLWRVKVPSEVLSIPVVADNTVIVHTTDGNVIALNEKTGAKQWHYEISVPALSVRGTGTPVIVDGNVIGGYDNGKLMALRLSDGKFVWESSVAIPKGRSEVERLVDLDVDPIEAGGVVFTASFHGGVSAVSALDGDVLWRNEAISAYSGISNDWRNLYLSDSAGDVIQLDQRSGSALWKQKELHQRKLSAPAVYDNYVVVGDFEGYVHWLSTTDGRQLARIKISDAAIEAKPIVIENTVFVYATDGTLAALTAH